MSWLAPLRAFWQQASRREQLALLGGGTLLVLVMLWLLHRHATERLFAFSLSMLLGGAIGNLWDRLLWGHVVDFLQFHYANWYFPSFNVADSAITVGAACLILDELLRVRGKR